MSRELEEFREFREAMNERILDSGHREIKRFFALDTRAYEEGALDVKTKELLGLTASMVLPVSNTSSTMSRLSSWLTFSTR